ncbi:MAG: phosphate acyltransferase PlsX [Verrucomicrobia bacterium RIFCSPHIGHO2_12_FULL_41_10]|nr:MAG: phosphate acyltransferase PlsX [Verrucomicrobia bacterium RIFCSPHIGHO2_12_FULL_41_10]HLB34551.1 phosphate acyltransferase PlsX [Chthoniobacterales bacterium]
MRIVLDAMGGDYAPANTVAGAVLALQAYPKITRLFLTGDETAIRAELTKLNYSDPRIEIVHTTQVVEMSDQAVEAVRRKKDSSISRAVDLVKKGDAEAVVSAGHTGAAVAATTIKLRTLEGVDRPGIASYLPTEKNICVLIDAGANIDARPEHMLQYAIMGSVLSKHVLGYANPAIGLMSIGGEDVKGSEFTKEIFKLLKASTLNFRGNIEGHDLFEHPVEVVLCDGFTGNVVLKTAEATAAAVFRWLKRELTKTPIRIFGAWVARNAFRAIRNRTNYETYGGSPLLGVNGICIIAHGSSSPLAIKNALRVAVDFIEQRINPRIVEELKAYKNRL